MNLPNPLSLGASVVGVYCQHLICRVGCLSPAHLNTGNLNVVTGSLMESGVSQTVEWSADCRLHLDGIGNDIMKEENAPECGHLHCQ
jgi:hypothetical protein